MGELDKKSFAELIKGAAMVFDKDIGTPTLKIYFSLLREFTFNEVSKGVENHLKNPKSGQFMPKPADIIREIKLIKVEPLLLESKGGLSWCENTQALINKYSVSL